MLHISISSGFIAASTTPVPLGLGKRGPPYAFLLVRWRFAEQALLAYLINQIMRHHKAGLTAEHPVFV